jgi:penicillin-insensitive murein DD-endopeptidase
VVKSPSRAILVFSGAIALLGGCAGTPTPLAPAILGSVGVPHHGVLTNAVELHRAGVGYALLRDNGVRWGNPRLVRAIEDAASIVARARPGGAPLIVGDLSARR